jgi:hypothetical protein
MRAGIELISSRLGRGTRNARLPSDDFTPPWSRHEARLPGARAGPLRRSPLRLDSAALLGPGVRGRTRCAPAALRSDNDRESVYEARCARHPRALRCSPPSMGPARAPGSRASCGRGMGCQRRNAESARAGLFVQPARCPLNSQTLQKRSFGDPAPWAAFAALLTYEHEREPS